MKLMGPIKRVSAMSNKLAEAGIEVLEGYDASRLRAEPGPGYRR